MPIFNPTRLTLARKRRGHSQSKLALLCDLTPQSISAYERGRTTPTEETIDRLAKELRFSTEFFAQQDLEEPSPDGASFRGMAAMTARQRDMALSAGAFAIAIDEWISSRFKLPSVDVPSMRGFDPEAAADALHAHWGIGEDACPNMVHLLESRGVKVFSLPRDSQQVHAFSFWNGDKPFVFLTTDTSGEKGRTDAAHELGHLVLHRHAAPNGRAAELEADQFAGAFLVPRSSALACKERTFTLESLIKLKRRWKVSLALLVHRFNRVGLISDWQYRALCIELAQRGFRKSEPAGIARESSQIFQKVFASLRLDGVTRRTVAAEIFLPAGDVDGISFGLMVARGGEASRTTSRIDDGNRRSKLRLLK